MANTLVCSSSDVKPFSQPFEGDFFNPTLIFFKEDACKSKLGTSELKVPLGMSLTQHKLIFICLVNRMNMQASVTKSKIFVPI
jgi:hypothetical protein